MVERDAPAPCGSAARYSRRGTAPRNIRRRRSSPSCVHEAIGQSRHCRTAISRRATISRSLPVRRRMRRRADPEQQLGRRRRSCPFCGSQRACAKTSPGSLRSAAGTLATSFGGGGRIGGERRGGLRQAPGNRPRPAAACAWRHRSGRPRAAGRAGAWWSSGRSLAAVAGEQAALVGGAEIFLDPRLAQRGGAGFDLAALDRQLGGARLAEAADRRVPLEPGGDGVVVGAGARQFGAPPHLLLRRPVRVLVDKGGDIGKSGVVGRAARIIEPANELQRQRILALAGKGISLRPIAAARAGERRRGRAVDCAVGRGRRRGRSRRAPRCRTTGQDTADRPDAKPAPPRRNEWRASLVYGFWSPDAS